MLCWQLTCGQGNLRVHARRRRSIPWSCLLVVGESPQPVVRLPWRRLRLLLDRDDRCQEDEAGTRDRRRHPPAEFGQELTQAQAGDGVLRLDLGCDQELVRSQVDACHLADGGHLRVGGEQVPDAVQDDRGVRAVGQQRAVSCRQPQPDGSQQQADHDAGSSIGRRRTKELVQSRVR
jgi:hypothetical protein